MNRKLFFFILIILQCGILLSAEEKNGTLQIDRIGPEGHKVLDPSGAEVGQINETNKSLSLPPGTYDVTFGKAVWKKVKVEVGKTTTLKPGTFILVGASNDGHHILTPDWKSVGIVNSKTNWIVLPPGNYAVEIYRTKKWFDLKEGKTVKLLIEQILHEE